MKKTTRMLEIKNNVLEVLEAAYHLKGKDMRTGKRIDAKCIIGQMACQAKIPIPIEYNEKVITDSDYDEIESFNKELRKAYGLTEQQLRELQRANDCKLSEIYTIDPNELEIKDNGGDLLAYRLKKYGLIDKDIKIVKLKYDKVYTKNDKIIYSFHEKESL